MRFCLYLSRYVILSLVLAWIPTLLWAAGAYRVEITKTEGDPAVVSIEPVGSQAQEAEGASNSAEARSETRSHHTHTRHLRLAPEPEVGDGSLFAALFQILAVVGDFGFYGGGGYWQAPLPTRFQVQNTDAWDTRPGMKTVNFGICINVPVFRFLELEPFTGLQFGEASQSANFSNGYVREKLTLSEAHFGLSLISPVAHPFFLELGIGGTSTTTTVDLETNLPAYAYEGFILDHAGTTQLTYGAGLYAPEDWQVRLRAGVQGYHQFADYGNSWGLRAYVTFLFTNKRLEYESL